MSIEIIESGEIGVVEEDLVEDDGLDPCPDGEDPSIEVDYDHERAVADAEHEGLPPVPDAGAELSALMKVAIDELYEIQDRLDAATDDHAEKADAAKTAKKRVESLQDDLSLAVKRMRDLKKANVPDPSRYPLYDKAAVNATFAKPESIPPLPPGDWEEFLRRKYRDTRLADLGLTLKVTSLLTESGYVTLADLGKLQGRPLTDLTGITEKRSEAIQAAIVEMNEAWLKEWDAAHPAAVEEATAEEGETLADPDGE